MDEIKDLMKENGVEAPAPPPTEIKKSTFDMLAKARRRKRRLVLASIAVVALLAAVVVGSVLLSPKAPVKIARGEAAAKATTSINNIGAEPNHVVIRRLGVDVPVYDDTEPGPLVQDDLLKGATYYDENTNKPGVGNTVIFAHSAVTAEHDAPFGQIGDGELKVGDEVVVTDSAKKQFVYVVDDISTIDATDFSVVRPRSEEEAAILTLITCIGPDYPRDKRLAVIAGLKKR